MGRDSEVTLFDVGANVGQTVERLAASFPNAAIYSFEPVPAVFDGLMENTAGLQRVECVNVALGSAPGGGVITTDRGVLNSMVPGVPSRALATVPVNTVDRFCGERQLDRIGLLKVDTEGLEVPVLRGAATMLAQGRIDFVLVECDFAPRTDGDPHGNFFEIHDLLAPFGFGVVSFYTGGVDRRGWVWGDALLVRQGCADDVPLTVSPFGPAIPPLL